MPFVVYQKGSAPAPTVPSATIQKRGLISINRAAMDLLKGDAPEDPEGVELLWDEEQRTIALHAVPLTAPNAYPLRAQGNKHNGPFLIAGTMFTKFIGLDTTEARRWTPFARDGLLCIDLNMESARVTGRGSRGGTN